MFKIKFTGDNVSFAENVQITPLTREIESNSRSENKKGTGTRPPSHK